MFSQLDYSPEQEREDALFFESQPYCGEAEADRERHYLWQAGFVSYCSCFACEGRREAEYADEDARREWEEASAEHIEEQAAWLFEEAERQRHRSSRPTRGAARPRPFKTLGRGVAGFIPRPGRTTCPPTHEKEPVMAGESWKSHKNTARERDAELDTAAQLRDLFQSGESIRGPVPRRGGALVLGVPGVRRVRHRRAGRLTCRSESSPAGPGRTWTPAAPRSPAPTPPAASCTSATAAAPARSTAARTPLERSAATRTTAPATPAWPTWGSTSVSERRSPTTCPAAATDHHDPKELDMRQTLNGVPFTDQQQEDYEWENYRRWAIGPLMSRENWKARNERIDRLAAAGQLPTNPYGW